ncbi:MAG: nitrophenyl compound nitroreductase subunit ArsF family protein [Candidatus Omnitrophica bacterium]|nr:nitrophenyl compound nitroreductase subunit ArsF family protein [Candidatus Omnitrophota bacterium]
MKKIILTLLVIAAVSISPAFISDNVNAQQAPATRVIAYYFHGDFRCVTCHKLEQYSKEAIETNFKDALASGKLEFKAVNVEGRGNEHFVRDYQLYTKSLVISLIKDGKEMKAKNLDKIWEYGGNKEKFFAYVTDELNRFLEGA